MYKPPLPEDDEPHDIPEFSYPARQRRASQSGTVHRRRVPGDYRTDERPGEPKIKRASLLREQQEKQAQLEAAAREEAENARTLRKPAPDTRRPREETGSSRAIRESGTSQRRPGEGTARRRAISETGISAYKTREETDPILVTRGRRSSGAYIPRKSASRPMQRGRTGTSSTHSWRSQPQPLFTRKRIITAVSLLVVMIVLFIPIALINKHNSDIAFLSNTPGAASTQPGLSGQSTPTHNLVIKPQDLDHPAPPVFATSAYLLDADSGDTLYAYQPFMHLPMLSTTKLMTASLAIEQDGNNLDQRIIITDAMSRDINQLSADSALFGIKKGETYTLRDLLYGLLFVSGNDAAIAIADTVGGNLQHFVDEMNAKAQQLGLYDTHFMNPHGLLQPGQYSSAHDLALLGKYSLGLPMLHQISSQNSYHIPAGGNHPERFLINENQFMWWYPGVDGGKTGYDGQSDFIQVMSVTRNHHHLIGVVMNTNNWWTDMRDLMNWGFDSFTWISPRDVDTQHAIPYDYLWNFFAKDTKDFTIPTADHGRYYVYTGYSISGPIMAYFDAHGGLQTFGYPTKLPTKPVASVYSQQFEHGTIQCNQNTNTCQQI
ncbi:MAG TPA: D-alanyl-D-alanine carboxypeptidase family protein [Ktedonobacteraceae bacterium]|nr:D-alanyl-D-alanine carboxypeptidase family protein [Ktedonobacteraceae bacterium]